MVIVGPINGALFLAWAREFLRPTLQPGGIVIANNFSSHKAARIREATEEVGAH